jgi:hypothetical protein
VLWTAFIVLLIFVLIGLSIQLGWVLIRLLLVVGFGGAGQPEDYPLQTTGSIAAWRCRTFPASWSPRWSTAGCKQKTRQCVSK